MGGPESAANAYHRGSGVWLRRSPLTASQVECRCARCSNTLVCNVFSVPLTTRTTPARVTYR